MTTCARPGCSRPQAGALLLNRLERRAELVGLGDPVGLRHGTALCDEHLARFTVPSAWTMIDSRSSPSGAVSSRPRVHGAPGSSTNRGIPAWSPRRGVEVPDELSSVRSPLLRRAFLGDDGLAGLGRVHLGADRDPQHLRGGVEGDGDHDGDREGRESDGDDRVDPYGADEVTGGSLESDAAARAGGSETEPAPSGDGNGDEPPSGQLQLAV